MSNYDFSFSDQGSIALLTPLTELAKEWLTENIASESWQYFGQSLALEPRLAEPILNGISEEGFSIELT